MAPFFALLLARDQIGSWRDIPRAIPTMLRRGWPALAAFVLLLGPYLVWNANAMIDDVWRWAAGSTETHYQIWGWGASNFVLAFGGIESRFDSWPFWILEVAVALPLLLWLGWRQARAQHHCGGLLALRHCCCLASSTSLASSTKTTWDTFWHFWRWGTSWPRAAQPERNWQFAQIADTATIESHSFDDAARMPGVWIVTTSSETREPGQEHSLAHLRRRWWLVVGLIRLGCRA